MRIEAVRNSDSAAKILDPAHRQVAQREALPVSATIAGLQQSLLGGGDIGNHDPAITRVREGDTRWIIVLVA
jgi:hypothetical protein